MCNDAIYQRFNLLFIYCLQVPITAQSSERLSHQLAISLTSDLRLSSQELDTLASIATALIGVASENVAVSYCVCGGLE